jgi:hypothetical protein
MNPPAIAHYEIHVRGILSARLLGAFPRLQARAQSGVTARSGILPDQAALYGVSAQLEALGLELLEVRRDRAPADDHPQSRQQAC